MMTSDRLQLLAAARVRRILPHPALSRQKNLGIFVFKICFEIFRRDITLYSTVFYARESHEMGPNSVTVGRAIGYRT
jgi:hypothetical protein